MVNGSLWSVAIAIVVATGFAYAEAPISIPTADGGHLTMTVPEVNVFIDGAFLSNALQQGIAYADAQGRVFIDVDYLFQRGLTSPQPVGHRGLFSRLASQPASGYKGLLENFSENNSDPLLHGDVIRVNNSTSNVSEIQPVNSVKILPSEQVALRIASPLALLQTESSPGRIDFISPVESPKTILKKEDPPQLMPSGQKIIALGQPLPDVFIHPYPSSPPQNPDYTSSNVLQDALRPIF